VTRTSYFDAPYPRRLAHRGLSQHQESIDENSLAAFQEAIDAGATHVESDTHATKDGTAVLFHDDDLQRVAGISTSISELRIADLRSLKLLNGSTIPTLGEVFESFPDLYLNLDIKSEQAIEPTVRAIEDHRAHDRVLVSSFSESRRLKALGLLTKPVATSASMRLVVLAWASHTFLLGAGFRTLTKSIDAFQIPPARGPIRFATKSFIKRAKSTDNEVHFWTINEPAEMQRLIELGADGIVTDRVDLLTKLKQS
jgi:glycerophosphoryl diester phosphodiesterase